MRSAPQGTPAPKIVTHHDPKTPAAEAFRVLRTNLQFMGLDTPLKSILLTSATPGEGKSTVAANMAVAFAQSGARVCLVDADLRRPMVAKMFQLDNWVGMTSALVGQSTVEASLQATVVEGLWAMPSGPIPPNPAELLGSARMAKLVAELEERFDMVIVDTPPLLAVTDACVLAPKVGGVLLVTRSGQVDRRQVQRAKESLVAVKANMLGVVLDGVNNEQNQGYYYYYYGAKPEERTGR